MNPDDGDRRPPKRRLSESDAERTPKRVRFDTSSNIVYAAEEEQELQPDRDDGHEPVSQDSPVHGGAEEQPGRDDEQEPASQSTEISGAAGRHPTDQLQPGGDIEEASFTRRPRGPSGLLGADQQPDSNEILPFNRALEPHPRRGRGRRWLEPPPQVDPLLTPPSSEPQDTAGLRDPQPHRRNLWHPSPPGNGNGGIYETGLAQILRRGLNDHSPTPAGPTIPPSLQYGDRYHEGLPGTQSSTDDTTVGATEVGGADQSSPRGDGEESSLGTGPVHRRTDYDSYPDSGIWQARFGTGSTHQPREDPTHRAPPSYSTFRTSNEFPVNMTLSELAWIQNDLEQERSERQRAGEPEPELDEWVIQGVATRRRRRPRQPRTTDDIDDNPIPDDPEQRIELAPGGRMPSQAHTPGASGPEPGAAQEGLTIWDVDDSQVRVYGDIERDLVDYILTFAIGDILPRNAVIHVYPPAPGYEGYFLHYRDPETGTHRSSRLITNIERTRLVSPPPEDEAPPPASEQAIANLESREITASEAEAETSCPICKIEKQQGDSVTVLPCNHWYDKECVEPWLRENGTCPECRAPIEEREENEDGGESEDGGDSQDLYPFSLEVTEATHQNLDRLLDEMRAEYERRRAEPASQAAVESGLGAAERRAASAEGLLGEQARVTLNVNTLPTRPLTVADTHEDGRLDCELCLVPREASDSVTELPCGHWFDTDCIEIWLRDEGTCPRCGRRFHVYRDQGT